MSSANDIKAAIERTAKTLNKKPATGRKIKKSTARMVNGLTCEIRSDDWTLTSDMPEAIGGNNAGPSPGALARMGLGSCLAIGYAMSFAWQNVPYEEIDVEVEGKLDVNGFYGVDESAPAGHQELQLSVNIVSSAPIEEIEEVMDRADVHSPVLNLIQNPIPLKRKLNLSWPAEPGGATG